MQVQVRSHVADVVDKADVISQVISQVLTQIFGEKTTRLIYRHLEHDYSLKSNEIAERIDVFAKGLEDFLSSGAYAVEHRILEDLRSYGLSDEPESTRAGFVDQVQSLTSKA